MNTLQRRNAIKDELQNQKLISAKKLALKYGVSRQTIVGDIALLRAQGQPIISTVSGYKYQEAGTAYHGVVVCQHTIEQTREELEAIISLGGEVVDVLIDHSVYGQIVGTLGLANQADINDFMSRVKNVNHNLLASLTNGIHLHNISCSDEKVFNSIQQRLDDLHFLYHD
ncbi:transcription repressor NadR [Liquorilactobacillus capillatus]|uniref:YrxA n=1 Tax=Liquorilactobacillus capillatus DSM 19910 TaxID=1423731 RepID=A0A0R1MCB0_9LACO|nr:transcription repressor NadR [Liquorilactobacillus capillatus]KRL02917.1 YrxA [Liquorilactobacillus capillatus DSM 19910]